MIRKILTTLAAALALTACTQDELAENPNALPQGKYPLEISSATLTAEVSEQPWGADAPQTRVSENTDGNSSVWDTGDIFYAQPEGATQEGTFKIDEGGSVSSLTTTYWTKTTEDVTAWYPQNGTVSLADQSQKLAYVLQATAKDASHDSSVSLSFKHRLAKVRVELSGQRAGKVTSVSLKDCLTQCNNNQGNVTAGSETGDIQMHKVDGQAIFEANVLPGENIATVIVNGIESTLTTVITATEAGKTHKVSLQVKAAGG